MKKRLKGVYTAMVTPFDAQLKFDEAGFRKNINFQIDNGIDGLVVLGTTGEAPTLSSNEQEQILKVAIHEARGRLPIIVGTGCYSTEKTIENTKKAEQLGADFALIVTPYYNRPTQEGMWLHFKAITEATRLPIIVYNIAGRTGQNLQTDTLKRLAELPSIVAVKESSGNIAQVSEVIESISRNNAHFSVLSGDDANTLIVMALGGHGIISVASNLIPKQIKELVDALTTGDYNSARNKHHDMMPLIRGLFYETNPIPIKTAMRHKGMAAGRCRLPLCDLLPDNERKLTALLS